MWKYAGESRVGDVWIERTGRPSYAQLSRDCNSTGSGSDHHQGKPLHACAVLSANSGPGVGAGRDQAAFA
jgi:hypothetical protein